MRDGAVLVDIRAESQRERDGVVPGSVFVARNVLDGAAIRAARTATRASPTPAAA